MPGSTRKELSSVPVVIDHFGRGICGPRDIGINRNMFFGQPVLEIVEYAGDPACRVFFAAASVIKNGE